ncbi:MAG: L,D-transpeptidase [Anaerolineae bacterium]|jgi:lipoprotein-anchoring transpeptidase ErfK/SrfK
MTRNHWLFVLALVAALSYGLLQSEQATVAEAPTLAAASGGAPAPVAAAPTATPAAASAIEPVQPASRPTFTPWPTPTAAPTVAPTEAATLTMASEPTQPAESPSAGGAVASAAPAPGPTTAPAANPSPYGLDTHPEEPRFIYVDQATQRLYIFEHGELLREIPCSTGLPESDKYTPAASGRVGDYWPTFTSFGVEADDAWYLFRSSGNILIHSLPYLRDEEGNKLYQDGEMLGVRPSSHGCIRIAPEDARWLTDYNPRGALFEVTEPYLDKWLALN